MTSTGQPKRLILQENNAKPHTAKQTQQNLKDMGWEVLLYPTHSSDITPSDHYLFQSLRHLLDGKTVIDINAIRLALSYISASLPACSYQEGFENLQKRWAEVVDSDGDYIID